MSDIDESVHVRPATTTMQQYVPIYQEDQKNTLNSGVLIRRSIDEGIAIWYICQYGPEANELFGGFVSEPIDKRESFVLP